MGKSLSREVEEWGPLRGVLINSVAFRIPVTYSSAGDIVDSRRVASSMDPALAREFQ